MATNINCIGTRREGDFIHLTRHDGDEVTLLATISTEAYVAGVALAKETKVVWPGGEVTPDGRVLFENPDQYATVGGGEHFAHARSLEEGHLDLDMIPEGPNPRIAFEDMRENEPPINPYLGAIAVQPEAL